MATSDSVITDRGSTFKNSVSTVGALGYIVGSSVSFQKTIIDNMYANYGGIFYAINESEI